MGAIPARRAPALAARTTARPTRSYSRTGGEGTGAPVLLRRGNRQGLPTCTAVAWKGLAFASGPPRMAANWP